MADPVIESLSAAQRDAAQTFLVDVDYVLYEPDSEDVTITLEWRRGTSGAWSACTPQASDRRHDDVSSPLSGLPTSSPGSALTFVWQAFFDLPEGTYDDVYLRMTAEDAAVETDQEEFGPFTVVAEDFDPDEDEILAAQLRRRSIISSTPKTFLGNGLVTPFRRASRDFASSSGEELIRACVRQVLGTRAAVGRFAGELPHRPDFGSKLWVLRHRRKDPTLREQAQIYVVEALAWEPRIQVTEVFVESEAFDDLGTDLRVRVRYRIISENIDDNRVFLPGDFEETISV